ncbi:MAG: glycosyltransferase [Candidatus Ryanbacteria bacterium]|nr:glycosyltransferase [Candidatus Ryanbacteria bacterium]
MSLLFFTKGDKSVGSSRQRVWLMAEQLSRAYGIQNKILYPRMEQFGSFTFLKNTIREHSVLIVHKSLFSWKTIVAILYGKYILGKSLIYDLDDAEWVHSRFKTILLARFANAVFAGSEIIEQWARRHNTRVVSVPTVVDAELYASFRVEYGQREISTIGWVGTGKGHFQDGHFHMIRPALDMLARESHFRFVIIGSQNHQPLKDYFKGAAFEVVFAGELDWSDPSAVPSAIHQYQFDVGLMPTKDTPFNRAKCAFKAIEYMACGVPVVASPVGENTRVVEDGVTGFHARTDIEWHDAIAKLLSDKELRVRMGEASIEKVREIYSYGKIVPEVRNILQDVLQ